MTHAMAVGPAPGVRVYRRRAARQLRGAGARVAGGALLGGGQSVVAADTRGVRVQRGDPARCRAVGHPSVTPCTGKARTAGIAFNRLHHLLVAHPDTADGHYRLRQALMTTRTGGRDVGGLVAGRGRATGKPGNEVVGRLEVIADHARNTGQLVATAAGGPRMGRVREVAGRARGYVAEATARLRRSRDGEEDLKNKERHADEHYRDQAQATQGGPPSAGRD